MKRALTLAGSLLLLAGCGTTVPGAFNASSGNGGLSSNGVGTGSDGSTGGNGSGSAGAVGTSTAVGTSGAGTGGLGTGSGGSGGSGSGGAAAVTGQSGNGTAPTGDQSTVATGPTTGSSPTGSKGPIQIGFIVTNVSNAGSFGVSSGQTFSDQQLYGGLVAAINKQGGLDGRQIQPVYGITDTADASWSTDFQAACANFTQDHHVAAVIGYIFAFEDTFEQCLTKAAVPDLYGGYQPGDQSQQAKYPYLIGTTNPTSQLNWEIGLGGAIESGQLTTKDKLGVIVDTCANDDTAFAQVGAPLLKAHGISFVTATGECGTGAGSDGTAASEIQSAELQFHSDGVDEVFTGGVPLLLMAESAETQGWHPKYLTTVAGAAFEGNVPTDQLSNFHGFGWMPEVDVDPQHQPYATTTPQKRCLSLLSSQGLVPKDYNDFMEAYTTCDGLFLYGAALAADGDSTAASSIVPAVAAQIPKTSLASVYGGLGQYNSQQHGGPAEWRQWGWVGSCSCFEYSGPTYPINS